MTAYVTDPTQQEIVRAMADSVQNTHQQVKAKILERMADWAKMFSKEPNLGTMEQAYMKLKSQSKRSILDPY